MTMSSDDQSPPELPLARYLASTDKKTRDNAVRSLALFLSTPVQDALPKSEMAKLWKGIFYCYWMSDKPLVQQALSSELADILLTISSVTASLAFLRGFWEATVREWNGIDRLRIDKYYMLVRKFVNASFRLLMRAEWDKDVVSEYNDILTVRGGPLYSLDIRVPASLSYHLADIYLAELDKVVSSHDSDSDGGDTLPLPPPLLSLLYPFLDLASRTNSNVTYRRIFDEIFDPLFLALKSPNGSPSEPPLRKRPRFDNERDFVSLINNSCLDDPKKEGKIDKAQFRKELSRKIFEIASGPDARESNRRKMYAVWKVAMAEDYESELDVQD